AKKLEHQSPHGISRTGAVSKQGREIPVAIDADVKLEGSQKIFKMRLGKPEFPDRVAERDEHRVRREGLQPVFPLDGPLGGPFDGPLGAKVAGPTGERAKARRVSSIALVKALPPTGERLQAAFYSGLVGEIIGAPRKRVNGGQRVALGARHQVGGDGEILVMPPGQTPALGIGS